MNFDFDEFEEEIEAGNIVARKGFKIKGKFQVQRINRGKVRDSLQYFEVGEIYETEALAQAQIEYMQEAWEKNQLVEYGLFHYEINIELPESWEIYEITTYETVDH